MLFVFVAVIIIGVAASCFINIYRIEAKQLRDKFEQLRKQNSSLLAKYQMIEDAHQEKKRIINSASFEAQAIIDNAKKL